MPHSFALDKHHSFALDKHNFTHKAVISILLLQNN